MNIPIVRFTRDKSGFSKTLRSRVDKYFTENDISRSGGASMLLKTVIMLSLYFIPWALFTFGVTGGGAWFWVAEIAMGVGLAGIGLNIMHDGNHNAYSTKPWINKLMGRTVDLVGGNADMWRIQHNVLHHTFTNINGLDEDIDPSPVLRFNPNKPLYKIHKFQHIYAWFFYSLMTIFWMISKDWQALARYKKKDLIKSTGKTTGGIAVYMVCSKLFYYFYSIALPILFSGLAWWIVVLGWVVMHAVAGFLMAIIFQPAHVLEHHIFHDGIKAPSLETERLQHQLQTSTNFGVKSRLLTWLCGGLNFQIEHHLFPNICHIHYRKIAPIVKKTAQEFGLPYRADLSFAKVLKLHTSTLKSLGKPSIVS
jgi:linoleoyl-CoA desaturase